MASSEKSIQELAGFIQQQLQLTQDGQPRPFFDWREEWIACYQSFLAAFGGRVNPQPTLEQFLAVAMPSKLLPMNLSICFQHNVLPIRMGVEIGRAIMKGDWPGSWSGFVEENV